jgi:hypothetical protein
MEANTLMKLNGKAIDKNESTGLTDESKDYTQIHSNLVTKK